MRPLGQGSAPGVYHGIVRRVRLQGGVLWAQVHIPSWSTPGSEYVTNWARVALPWGTHDYGLWGSIHEGEHVLVAFEEGDPERPWVVGFVPMPQEPGDVEAPPEWLNDVYSDKTPNPNSPPGRENPPQSGPPILPGAILKSPLWKQYVLLHDKLKKVVIRTASEGGGDWVARPTEEKPEILLGELARHNVLLGDLFMELYNRHCHTGVLPGPALSGPPQESDRIKPEEHLSHVVYVVRDPWDQAPSSSAFKAAELGKRLFQALAGGGGGGLGGAVEVAERVAQEMAAFCADPAGYMGQLAERAGLPGPVLKAAQDLVGNFADSLLNAAKSALKAMTGVEIPDVQDLCQLARKLKEKDLAGVAGDLLTKVVPAALAAVGIPPSVTDAALDLAQACLNQNFSMEQVMAAVGGKHGAQGIAALAGALASAFGR